MDIKNRFSGLLLIAAIALIMPSCSKKEDSGNIPEADIALAQDQTYADALFDNLDDLAFTEIQQLDVSHYLTTEIKSTSENICYTVTVDHPDTTSFPKEITIDFGEGCNVVFNGDTITRSGQIIITITNRWFIPDAQFIMTFNDFYFNGAKIEGTRTLTNNGLNSRNNLEISTELENGKITFSETLFMTRTSSQVHEYSLHMNPLNDTIYLTGSAHGTNVMGETYSHTIIDPLTWVRCSEMQYRWALVAGKIEITNSARGTMTVEHSGDGCGGDVIVEKDGNRYNYQFRYRYRYN